MSAATAPTASAMPTIWITPSAHSSARLKWKRPNDGEFIASIPIWWTSNLVRMLADLSFPDNQAILGFGADRSSAQYLLPGCSSTIRPNYAFQNISRYISLFLTANHRYFLEIPIHYYVLTPQIYHELLTILLLKSNQESYLRRIYS
ncbi:MAG: hypothetical protein QHC89_16930 [Bosea sp. (in: a-proteobacteria)]|nr:hypothetical protein [Bosea sp. (in: a-proteobacteria)]